MPVIGAGLYLALAIFCAVHAMRTHKPHYWLFILFAFPLLGSIVYLLVVYLPTARLERSARRAVTAVAYRLDPERGVRAAQDAYEQTPTAQNRMRLALALLDAGRAQEAVTEYEACMAGPFASDPEIRLGAARAYVECERYPEALRMLQALTADRPDYQPDDVALLHARTLAGLGRHEEARAAFDSAVARYGTYAVRAEQAVWQYATGQTEAAQANERELQNMSKRWGAQTRELNAAAVQRLKAARELSLKRAG